MIYVTSDLHFNHDKDFIWSPRNYRSVDDMNASEVANWNSCVSDSDDIYVLGDLFMGNDFEFIEDTLGMLKGKIHLIVGNHDTPSKLSIYSSASNVVEIAYGASLVYQKRRFYLTHYPTITTNFDDTPDKAIFNLFGHTHSKDKFYNGNPYMYNVAVDAHNNMPVSMDEIMADIDEELERYLV